MATVLETIQNFEWDCPKHPWREGAPVRVKALSGAGGDGCRECLVALVAEITLRLGVKFPPKRDPGPHLPMSSDTTLACAMKEKAREIGHLIGDSLLPGYGFCLMLFAFEGRQLEWICNAQRPDMILLLDEFKELLLKENA